jgi:large subunit ribosomal protein L9
MATKLLLIEDVEDLGRSGDIVNVKPGYARNFLLPQGFGVVADKHALRMQERLQEERKKRAIHEKQEAEKTASNLEGVTIETIVKVDHEGHMYGSVSAHDIVDLLKGQTQIVLEKRAIILKHPIKATGTHEIAIKLKENVSAAITLKVVPEESKHGSQQASAE